MHHRRIRVRAREVVGMLNLRRMFRAAVRGVSGERRTPTLT